MTFISANSPVNPAITAFSPVSMPPGAEDQARADLYALLSRLLLAAPDAALLDALASSDPILAEGGDPALEHAWDQLTMASGVMDAELVHEEFASLFISVGTPPVDPYGSRYLAGYMNDTPLAHLREDLARLGVARIQGRGEFEDHLGALCETMRVLVAGAPGIRRQPLEVQRQFFSAHIGSWCARALDDIANAEGANYYRLVARFAQAFLAIETEAFAVGEETDEQA